MKDEIMGRKVCFSVVLLLIILLTTTAGAEDVAATDAAVSIVDAYGPNLFLGNGVVHIFYDRYDLGETVDDDIVDDDVTDDDVTDDDEVDNDDDAVNDDDDDECGC